MTIEYEDIYPRDEAHRFRLYLRAGDKHEVFACTPTAEGVGVAIVQHHKDLAEAGRSLNDLGQIGVYDALDRVWIVSPWPRAGAR